METPTPNEFPFHKTIRGPHFAVRNRTKAKMPSWVVFLYSRAGEIICDARNRIPPKSLALQKLGTGRIRLKDS